MVTVEEAVRTATDYVKSLFDGLRELRLEEVEIDDKGAWSVTLSFFSPGTNLVATTPIGKESMFDPFKRTAIGIDPRRTFKLVELDAEGRVIAVRIRPIVVG